MTLHYKLLLTISAIGFLLSSCNGKNDPDPTEKIQLTKLAKTWTISSVKLDGQSRDDFGNLSLVIQGNFNNSAPEGPYQYTVSGTRPNPSPWPANGTWKFSDGESAKSVLIRDTGINEVQMTYTLANNGDILTLNFTVSGSGWQGSRVDKVGGEWEFIFNSN